MDKYRILVIAMTAAIAVNVLQFRQIEAETRHNYRAFHPYDTDDLFEIAISLDGSARLRVAPFHYLGKLFPDSTIIIPVEGVSSWFPFQESVLSFGRAADIRQVAYDPVSFIDVADLEEYRVDTRSFVPDAGRAIRIVGERVSYFVDGAPSGTFLVLTPEGPPGRTNPIAFVDIGILDDEAKARLGLS